MLLKSDRRSGSKGLSATTGHSRLSLDEGITPVTATFNFSLAKLTT